MMTYSRSPSQDALVWRQLQMRVPIWCRLHRPPTVDASSGCGQEPAMPKKGGGKSLAKGDDRDAGKEHGC